MEPSVIIVSSVPGRRVGAHVFTGAKEFPADHFTADELKLFAADRALTVVVGKVMVAEEVDEFLSAFGELKASRQPAGGKGKATK